MEVIFLTGSSGCGKSRKLYDTLSEESVQNPNKRFFLVVPEQFTMQAQKNIVELSRGHGSFNIDIVSFNRLAYRVFEELGVSLLTTINDTGKNMILRKVIDENKKRLEVIRPKDTQGFVSEIKSVISELLQYSVTPQMLAEACGRITGDGINHNERLKRKLK
ncbi:MAG: ATP-dependent helicase, partial [Lachnospiraceae bacterium]